MYKIITDCDDCYKGREGCAQERGDILWLWEAGRGFQKR